METGSGKGLVLVTGGTGFIASWMIKRLLEEGYCVRTTVRPSHPGTKKDLRFLTNLPGASDRLRIFEADLNEPDSFAPAVDGCTGVFHLTHAIDITNAEPEEVVTNRAVRATLGILKACVESRIVKRVVYTSSVVAVSFNGTDKYGCVVDEGLWSDPDYYRSVGVVGTGYVASKTMSERAALGFAEENGLDLVTVIPPLVVGPFICPHVPFSISMALALFFVKIACSSLKDIDGFKLCDISSKKPTEAGFKYKYGLDEMFDGALQSCIDRGFHFPGL